MHDQLSATSDEVKALLDEAQRKLELMQLELSRSYGSIAYEISAEIDSETQLGELLSQFRNDEGVEVNELALQCDLSRATIGRILKNPESASFHSVKSVVEALGAKICIVK